MKQLATLVFWFAVLGTSFSQNRFDNNWIFANLSLGGNIVSFNGDGLHISSLENSSGRAREALACMSDSSGNLLFYTNNCTVIDKNHQIMEGGEG
ncbi:MAG TPA: hypothetical protein DCF33_21045, partial [Saprospirales bacterium]|nr:hypothetical protein [Saprospirales bacterium]